MDKNNAFATNVISEQTYQDSSVNNVAMDTIDPDEKHLTSSTGLTENHHHNGSISSTLSLERHTKDNVKTESEDTFDLLYGISSSPPWHQCVLLAFQHYMTIFMASLFKPVLLTDNMCAKGDVMVKAELAGNMFFVCGFVTLLQVLVGVRLPIVQSSTFVLLVPTLSYLQLSKNSCPLIQDNCTMASVNETCVERGSAEYEELWQSRIQVIQGSVIIGSLVELLLGLTGVIGLMVKYIGPLTICPTISLLGISLFRSAADYGAKNWCVCLMTLVFLVIFSQYLGFFQMPLPKYTRKDGCRINRYPFLKMFPVISAILLSWLICYILTVTNAIPDDSNHWAYGGRTDINSELLANSPWFNFFWPGNYVYSILHTGKYGSPSLDVALILGLLVGFMSSIVESIGDYYACARMSDAPPPPRHAINRGRFYFGIAVEGFGCMLAGVFGTGNGTTSMSMNIALIGITRVASRTVIIYTAFIMIIFAIFNKFGALFVSIPDPIIGASFFVLFGMIVAVGMSNLQFVDMNSSRNLFVFGFSFFSGLTISEWMIAHPDAINTGWEPADSVFTVLLGTGMFVGGLLGFILDNSIPGSQKERGMLHMHETSNLSDSGENQRKINQIYDIPWIGKYMQKFKITKYIPICPSYSNDDNYEDTDL